MANKQIHIFFSGRVQGVGFRFTTEDIARSFNIVGWVKNLPDARVEVIAEADEDSLKKFLKKIKNNFFGYIENTEVEWLSPCGEFKDFTIRF